MYVSYIPFAREILVNIGRWWIPKPVRADKEDEIFLIFPVLAMLEG
jgi:hypothetical protein